MDKTEIKRILSICTEDERRDFVKNLLKGNPIITTGAVIITDPEDQNKTIDGRKLEDVLSIPREGAVILLPANGREVV